MSAAKLAYPEVFGGGNADQSELICSLGDVKYSLGVDSSPILVSAKTGL
jgi:hypothetical protein